MASNHSFQRAYKEHYLRRSTGVHEAEDRQELIAQQPAVVGLQQHIGNQGVQRLLAQGRLSSQGIVQNKPEIQRCGCGGSCATCKGQEEQLSVSAGIDKQVQRFWGDDEEEDGGSWWDSATDWVSETAGDAWNAVSDTAGGNSGSETSEDSDSDGSGSWLDDAADWASDTWDDWTGGGEADEEEASDTEDSDWTDWLPDWLTGEDSEEEAQDLPDISAECETEDGIGFGGAKQMKLHGRTVSNYNHGKPIPEPFPSSVTVTTGKRGKDDVFSASGTFEVDFLASPTITLPSVPSGLKPCQEKVVQAFIDGPLTAHENDHKAAFKDNYDGKFTATVDVKNIKDTTNHREIAMRNPVNAEDQKRTVAANKKSKKLDPWKKTVEGLDCK
jgi:hypothetical protein